MKKVLVIHRSQFFATAATAEIPHTRGSKKTSRGLDQLPGNDVSRQENFMSSTRRKRQGNAPLLTQHLVMPNGIVIVIYVFDQRTGCEERGECGGRGGRGWCRRGN